VSDPSLPENCDDLKRAPKTPERIAAKDLNLAPWPFDLCSSSKWLLFVGVVFVSSSSLLLQYYWINPRCTAQSRLVVEAIIFVPKGLFTPDALSCRIPQKRRNLPHGSAPHCNSSMRCERTLSLSAVLLTLLPASFSVSLFVNIWHRYVTRECS